MSEMKMSKGTRLLEQIREIVQADRVAAEGTEMTKGWFKKTRAFVGEMLAKGARARAQVDRAAEGIIGPALSGVGNDLMKGDREQLLLGIRQLAQEDQESL